MRNKPNPPGNISRCPVYIFLVLGLCCFFYFLGAWQKSGLSNGEHMVGNMSQLDCKIISTLDFEPHHKLLETSLFVEPKAKVFKPCSIKYKDYTPCQEQGRAVKFLGDNMIYRERHCPLQEEKLKCLIPAPKGYKTPFPWPKGRDYVHFLNVPYKHLTIEKAGQNWVQDEGDVFKFLGGGTMFPHGADAYIDELASVIPIADGSVRTALDTGCGVASWGAYLLNRNVLTMSFADNHEAQVQFALEHGVPAVIGVLGTIKLPYPSNAFDMAQCSRCIVNWTEGMYLMEVDRVLRPGGYWILSGPPINWRTWYQTWKQSEKDLKAEQTSIEELAEQLCWEKKYEKGDIAIWRKRINSESCKRKPVNICKPQDADDVWYKKMETCVTPFPDVTGETNETRGELKKFPARLFAIPPRIARGSVPGVTVESYDEDNKKWKKHVNAYKRINSLIGSTRYRNIMDMNAGLGGFAAAVDSLNSWVMNVVPNIAENTLGVVYERGLIGIYHDWCEGFSTYPRTYDLIHASGFFSLYQNKCDLEDILLEMDRILRPEGVVLIRDEVDVINKVTQIIKGLRWDTKMVDHDDGPLVSEKILVAKKQYWVGDEKNSTSSDESIPIVIRENHSLIILYFITGFFGHACLPTIHNYKSHFIVI